MIAPLAVVTDYGLPAQPGLRRVWAQHWNLQPRVSIDPNNPTMPASSCDAPAVVGLVVRGAYFVALGVGDLPAEGLLGAARLAPSGSPWRAINAAARRCRTRLVLCRGFEWIPINESSHEGVLEPV